MRLVKNKIEHDGSGTVTLFPEEPEDMVRESQQQSHILADTKLIHPNLVARIQPHSTRRPSTRKRYPPSHYNPRYWINVIRTSTSKP